MADNKGVLVVGDIIEGKMAAITAEMLGAGKKLATKLAKLFQPVKEGKCEIVEGENIADAAAKLALRLREAKVL